MITQESIQPIQWTAFPLHVFECVCSYTHTHTALWSPNLFLLWLCGVQTLCSTCSWPSLWTIWPTPRSWPRYLLISSLLSRLIPFSTITSSGVIICLNADISNSALIIVEIWQMLQGQGVDDVNGPTTELDHYVIGFIGTNWECIPWTINGQIWLKQSNVAGRQ